MTWPRSWSIAWLRKYGHVHDAAFVILLTEVVTQNIFKMPLTNAQKYVCL